MNTRRNPEDWSKIVTAFERSDSTHEDFCASRNLNIGTFRQALYRTRRAACGSSEPIAMISIDVTSTPTFTSDAASAASGEIVIVVADVAVRVTPSTDVEYVARLVGALRARC